MMRTDGKNASVAARSNTDYCFDYSPPDFTAEYWLKVTPHSMEVISPDWPCQVAEDLQM